MLNISNQPSPEFDFKKFRSSDRIFGIDYYRQFNKFLIVFFGVLFIFMFLPWTQNITGQGYVTTLQPDKRPQTIQSPIPGRIEQWFVNEGDFVTKGDTILRISEIKSDYFDPELLKRTSEQLEAKQGAMSAYRDKINALEAQLVALEAERELKLNQARNKVSQTILKVQNDSIKFEAAKTDRSIAEVRLQRDLSLFEKGLKSTREVEEKRIKLRETEAKYIGDENNFQNSKNDVAIARIEIERLKAEYAEKLSKTRSDLATASSNRFEAEGEVAKIQNTLANYTSRATLGYVLAPQSGFINKAIKGGIGETFKEGDQLVSIMPDNYQMAVETYVRPIDMPLIKVGEKARIEFDGWPAIVFSGWPNVSYGTYGAKVVAIENFISDNNLYRVLLAPDPDDHPWPNEVRIGSGARTIALLNNVPIGYEIWRQLNGFPPEYYKPEATKIPKLPIKVK
ncbi:MAG: HlyD family efflux transporter periplasmic adaptor subunit [Bacteroidetes bacterium]|nr:HlyD family efflux transporter periplasmic adaptor subunit [Bacteroidota bacterium]